ncbi:MAG: ribulose-phosphate 3-epimerase [Deltaproteobacteria bacterium]|nr:ribulose-phosphate 3-epimerase [Deltaproteobacteria bacterium]
MNSYNDKTIIAPSILSADFSRLSEEIAAIENGGADMVHVDVMDGHFVPNITIGPPVTTSIRKVTNLPLDVHLMIEDPDRYIEPFAKAGADILTVHVEACIHLNRTLQYIKDRGCKAGVALNPATSLSTLDCVLSDVDMVLLMTVNPGFGGQTLIPHVIPKIKRLREAIDAGNLDIDIEVDGGITVETIAQVAQAGANVFVAGNAVFTTSDYTRTIGELRRRSDQASRP